MKRLVAVLLLCATSAFAQQNLRAPVNVATRLYKDCINVKISGDIEIEPTRVGIAEFIADLDDWCLAWTLIWYQGLLGHSMVSLPITTVQRFNNNRLAILQAISDTIKAEALK